MSDMGPRVRPPSQAEKSPTTARNVSDDAEEEDRNSYEELREKRVAKMRQLMLPLVQASQNL